MKKTPLFIVILLMMTVVSGFMSCGPSAEEIARQDSISVADSLRRIDSLRIVDSIKVARAKEDSIKMLRTKVDAEAAKHKGCIKNYDLGKIIYTGRDGYYQVIKTVIIENIATGEKKSIPLKESDLLAGFVGLDDMKDNKHVKATLACNGVGIIFYASYTINLETETASKVKYED